MIIKCVRRLSVKIIARINYYREKEKKKARNIIKEKIEEYNIPINEMNNIKNGSDFRLEDGSIIENEECGKEIRFSVPVAWMKYILEKGFIAIDGCSLTVVNPNKEKGEFSVCFIPHTLENTLFGTRKVGDLANVEIDAQTQAIVSTVESFLLQHKINI